MKKKEVDEGFRYGCSGYRRTLASSGGAGTVKEGAISNKPPDVAVSSLKSTNIYL